MSQSIFDYCIRLFAVLQQIWMRLIWYLRPIRIETTVFGISMYCDAREFIQKRIRFFHIFEHNLTYYILETLREGDVFVDIGANVGYFTLLASSCVGASGKVIAIEADPSSFEKLTQNLLLNRCLNVSARNVAATAGRCKVEIKRPDAHDSGKNRIAAVAAGEGVEGLPFRDLVAADLGRLRFIKIDIEGSESPVLNGILEALSDLPDDLIVAAEISAESAEYVARVIAAGFRAYAIQNIYTIDYYLLRSYLQRFGEDKAIHRMAVKEYIPCKSDYIFERAPQTAVQISSTAPWSRA